MTDASAAAARAAIEALLYTYAERIDAGDLRGVAELFRGAIYRGAQGGEYHGADAVYGVLSSRVVLYDGIPRTRHVTTNVVIDVDLAAGTATARSYFTVLQGVAGQPLQPIVAGRYHDQFVCAVGAWRFADRLIFMDLIGDLSRHLRIAERGA
jgi:3-phenylpropionate/cinnamic acid dioxygenase small subunit